MWIPRWYGSQNVLNFGYILYLTLKDHTDKPLLYYGKKLAAANGFRVKDVPYGGFASGIKGNPDKMRLTFQSALEQSEAILRDVDLFAGDGRCADGFAEPSGDYGGDGQIYQGADCGRLKNAEDAEPTN